MREVVLFQLFFLAIEALACEALSDPVSVLFVDLESETRGNGSECLPFQSLWEGLEAAALIPTITLHLLPSSLEAQVLFPAPISNSLTIIGSPSTLRVDFPLSVTGTLTLWQIVFSRSTIAADALLVCTGTVMLDGVAVEGSVQSFARVDAGRIEMRNSTFSGFAAPIVFVSGFDSSMLADNVRMQDAAELIFVDRSLHGEVTVTLKGLKIRRFGGLLYCTENSATRFEFALENAEIEGSSKELFGTNVTNSVVTVKNTAVVNSQQLIAGSVINSNFTFINCTFGRSKNRLIDLNSLLGRIIIHNSTITEIALGPLFLIPANQYKFTSALISLSSCFISSVKNTNERVTGGIANAAAVSLELRDSVIANNTVYQDGLFLLTGGSAVIDNLHFHDSSAMTYSLYEAVASVVEVSNMRAEMLRHSAGRFAICVHGSQCLWTNVSITDSINPIRGSTNAFILLWPGFSSSAIVRNSFFRNTGRSYPCMGPTDNSQLLLYNTTFSDLTNNAIFVTYTDSYFEMRNVTLIRPQVAKFIVCSYSDQCANVSDLRIQGEATMPIVADGSGRFVFADSTFVGISVALFSLSSGYLTVKNVTVVDLHGFFCRGCISTTISITSLKLHSFTTFNLFQASLCSITIVGLTVTNTTTSAFFSLESCSFSMQDGTFSHVGMDSYGGFLTAVDSIVDFHSLKFEDAVSSLSIRIGLIHLYNCHLRVNESVFRRFNSTLIYAFESIVQIEDSQFEQGGLYLANASKAVRTYGGVLWSENSPIVNITNCLFQQLSADFGGALYLQGKGSEYCYIAGSMALLNNASEKGGFAYISKVKTVILGSKFLNNTARYGGVVWSVGSSGELLVRINASLFVNNSAVLEGGAVQTISCTCWHENSLWRANTAPYGSNFASRTSALAVVRNATFTPLRNFTIQVASGQTHEEKLLIGCLDELDQIVVTQLSTKMTLEAERASVNIPILLEAKEGVFVVPSFTIVGNPNDTVIVSAVLSTGLQQAVITVRIRDCVPGEHYTESRCDLCTHNTYSLSPSQPCTLCPDHADCPHGYRLDLHSGYWRTHNMTDTIHKCIVTELCTGGFESQCAEGHAGVMCAHCDDLYFKVNQLQCVFCNSRGVAAFKAISTLLISTASIVFSQFLSENLQMTHVVVFDYMQSTRITANYNIFWPKTLAYFYTVIGDFGSVGLTAFTDSCLFAIPGTHRFPSQLIIAALFFTLSLATVGLLFYVPRKLHQSFRSVKILSVLLYFGYILLPPMCIRMLQGFACFHIEGKYYLIHDSSLECWTSEHLTYSIVLSLPITLITIVTAATALCAAILPKFASRQPHFRSLTVFFLRKLTLSAVLLFSNAWELCTQAGVVICVNIVTEIVLYRFSNSQDMFYHSLYQSTLIASTLQSFFCVIYYAAESGLKENEAPFVGVNIVSVMLPAIYWIFEAFRKPGSRGTLKVAAESAENPSLGVLESSVFSGEFPLKAPNTSFASGNASMSDPSNIN